MDAIAAFAGLFAAAFLAATLVPAQSEAVLVGLLMLDRYPALALLAVASAGNVLGSCLNYGLRARPLHRSMPSKAGTGGLCARNCEHSKPCSKS